MKGDFIQDQEKDFVHVLDLYVTHSNTKKQNMLRIIQGLLGMFKQISDLKKACAFGGNQHSQENPARFASTKFESEKLRRYKAFHKSWDKQLTLHCKSYIQAYSLPVVYDEDFSFLVNDKTIEIKAKDQYLNLSDDDAQVQL